MPSVVGNGLALGVIMAAVQYTGGSFFRDPHDMDIDQFPTKEELRKRFRRPVNETINELGEGRGKNTSLKLYGSPMPCSCCSQSSIGIYGAGYEERRKQRIKEKYGIDVPEPYWKSQ